MPLVAKRKPKKRSEAEIQSDLLEVMAKTGRKLLDNRIVDDPRMVDVGMIWGGGFPPDRGGPLRWADLIGMSEKLFGKTFY